MTDGGPWQGPTEADWVERIARPVGESVPWIKRAEPVPEEDDPEEPPSELERLADWGDR